MDETLDKLKDELNNQQIGDAPFPKNYIPQVVRHLKYNNLRKLHMKRNDHFLLFDNQVIGLVAAFVGCGIHMEELSFPNHQITGECLCFCFCEHKSQPIVFQILGLRKS
jgi:hypothetical protein